MVAPGSLVSWSVPMVTASVAVLIETIEADPNLSADADAKKPEVLKAVLGASATHSRLGAVNWSNAPVSSGPDRGFSSKPLDPVVGTGTCNIDRAHRVMTGGRFDGEIAPFGPAAPASGWGSVPLTFGQSRWFRFDLRNYRLLLVSYHLNRDAGWFFCPHPTFRSQCSEKPMARCLRCEGKRAPRSTARAMWPVMLPWTTWNTSTLKI